MSAWRAEFLEMPESAGEWSSFLLTSDPRCTYAATDGSKRTARPSPSASRHDSQHDVPDGAHRATEGTVSGPEHYAEAERPLNYVREKSHGWDGVAPESASAVTLAQVHGTLASAAAIALGWADDDNRARIDVAAAVPSNGGRIRPARPALEKPGVPSGRILQTARLGLRLRRYRGAAVQAAAGTAAPGRGSRT